MTYPRSTTPQQISAFVNFNNRIEDDPFGSTIGIWQYSALTGETAISNCYEYTKPVPNPPAFDEYLSIAYNTSDTMRITNVTDLTQELALPSGSR